MTYTPSEQANIDALRRLIAFEARGDWDSVYSLVTEDFVTTMGNLVLRGKAEMRAFYIDSAAVKRQMAPPKEAVQ